MERLHLGNTDGNGIGKFKYAAIGFLALCSKNLPEPTIPEGKKYFDTLLWTGNDNRSITGLDFSPDWVWVKRDQVVLIGRTNYLIL